MKTFRIFSFTALLMALATVSFSQVKTDVFKVSGNCGMCKTRIEKTAKLAGASEANWDKDTKQLAVTYESSLTTAANIQQKLAEVGHDNNGYVATDEVYNKLPGCCKYERAPAGEEKMDCCKDGKCSKEGHNGKDCCIKEGEKMDCSKKGAEKMDCSKKDGEKMNCSKKEGEKMDCCKKGAEKMDCSKKDGEKMDCCKDGKCTKEGHDGKDCCKKAE